MSACSGRESRSRPGRDQAAPSPAEMASCEALTCTDDLSTVSRSCPLTQPEIPEKSQRTPTTGVRSFGSMQGAGARCGVKLAHLWFALAERHHTLIQRLAARRGAWSLRPEGTALASMPYASRGGRGPSGVSELPTCGVH